MSVDGTGLGFDPSPSGYEQIRTERKPERFTHCYRYGDRIVELVYRKQDQRLDIDGDLLYRCPWFIDGRMIDPYQFDTAQLATFFEKAIGLHAEIDSWTITNGIPQITVNPEAGVMVRNLRGEVVETLVPTAAVEPP